MAQLSCIDTVKTRSRNPSKRVLEFSADDLPRTRRRVSQRPSNQIYAVEIVEEDQYKVKIHYSGYSSSYDEWIRRSEIIYRPSKGSSPDENLSLISALACTIKQKLVPSRKHKDPAVRIQMPFDSCSFQLLQRKGKNVGTFRGNKNYTVVKYSDLDELLGERWHIRVVNVNGDFSYAILETIRFYLTQPRPLLDMDFKQNSTGELELVPFFTEQQKTIVFTFVRGDGNKNKLKEFL